jgi:hypothetical protein
VEGDNGTLTSVRESLLDTTTEKSSGHPVDSASGYNKQQMTQILVEVHVNRRKKLHLLVS